MPERSYNGEGYRYGFNGQEQDDEISGDGNTNSALYWEYDTRLCRRWNKDPITISSLSPYTCLSDNPIAFVDINGDIVDRPKTRKERKRIRQLKRTDSQFKANYEYLDKLKEHYAFQVPDEADGRYLRKKGKEDRLERTLGEAADAGVELSKLEKVSQRKDNDDDENPKVHILWYDPGVKIVNITLTERVDLLNERVKPSTGYSNVFDISTSIPNDLFAGWSIDASARRSFAEDFNSKEGKPDVSIDNSASTVTKLRISYFNPNQSIVNRGDGIDHVNDFGYIQLTAAAVAMGSPKTLRVLPDGTYKLHTLTSGQIVTEDRSLNPKSEEGQKFIEFLHKK